MVNKDFEELDDNYGVAQRKWTNDWDDICIDMVTTDDPIFVMQMTECIYSDHDILVEWAKVNVKLAAKVLRNMVQRQGIAVYASRNYQEVVSIVEACELNLDTPAKHGSSALAI
ncbi:MAG: hypothetical protein IPJ18_20205 [Betaproteobacteria bacterium]|nr:hypothetical protein [Betaproteobacteria bacterium]